MLQIENVLSEIKIKNFFNNIMQRAIYLRKQNNFYKKIKFK